MSNSNEKQSFATTPSNNGYELVSTKQYHSIDTVEGFDAESEQPSSNNTASTESVECSVLETSFNLISVIMGSGILSLPYAAKCMGWTAIGALLVLGCMFMYAFTLLAQVIRTYLARLGLEKTFIVDYLLLGRYCFGQCGESIVMLTFSAELLLALMSFLMTIAINLELLFHDHISFTTGIILGAIANIILCSLHLKLAAYSSAIGSAMIILTLAAIYMSGEEMKHQSLQEYKTLDTTSLSLSGGLIAFCFGGHSTFPKLFAAMKEPQRTGEVVLITAVVVLSVYVAAMALGYRYYAQFTLAPITLNIGSDLIGDEPLRDGKALKLLAAFGVVCNLAVSCPLVTLPVRDALLRLMCPPTRTTTSADNRTIVISSSTSREWMQVLAAIGVTTSAALLALCLQHNFAAACSLVGAVASFTDSIILPLVFFHCIHPLSNHSIGLLCLHVGMLTVAVLCFGGSILSTLCLNFPTYLGSSGLCSPSSA